MCEYATVRCLSITDPKYRLYCKWENSARAAGKRDSNLEKYQLLWDAGETRAPIGDRHPDFRYTL